MLKTIKVSGVFIVNFQHISHLAQVFILLTFSRKMPIPDLFIITTDNGSETRRGCYFIGYFLSPYLYVFYLRSSKIIGK